MPTPWTLDFCIPELGDNQIWLLKPPSLGDVLLYKKKRHDSTLHCWLFYWSSASLFRALCRVLTNSIHHWKRQKKKKNRISQLCTISCMGARRTPSSDNLPRTQEAPTLSSSRTPAQLFPPCLSFIIYLSWPRLVKWEYRHSVISGIFCLGNWMGMGQGDSSVDKVFSLEMVRTWVQFS